jgi:glycosyltransferase involved in cell wall biosynthesis
MKLAMVVPGGVDRSGEWRVIPALLALIERLARVHDVHVFVLRQEAERGSWPLLGATVHNIGDGWTRMRAIGAIHAEHRRAPFDLVQAIFSGSCGFLAVAMAKWLGVPSLVHIGGGELVALREIGYGGRLSLRGRLREALVLRAADAVTAASAPIIDALHALGLQAQRIPLGVDLKQWPPLAPRGRNGAQARLIHVASLNRVKDQRTLLYALAALAQAGVDFHMDIAGVDTLRGEIQHLAEQLGLTPRIQFLGFKTQRELRPIMASADVLVLSSLHEAGPLVLLEAAVLGIPTVGTAVGHLAEWSPQAACAVPVGDWRGLADAIAYVLRHDDLRLHLAGEAQRRAIAEDADYTAGMFEALYRPLLIAREVDGLRVVR